MSKKMKCPKCEYEWSTRKDKPKECPRCKNRLDSIKRDNLKVRNAIKLNKEARI
tara:strand:+ start:64 stop:225 length:162 start_codon:yes stop_codon:yes gene_type:complete